MCSLLQEVLKSHLKNITPTYSAKSHPKSQFDLSPSYINWKMAQSPLHPREVRTMLSPFFLSISMMSVSYIGFLFRNFQRKESLVRSEACRTRELQHFIKTKFIKFRSTASVSKVYSKSWMPKTVIRLTSDLWGSLLGSDPKLILAGQIAV